MWSRRAPQGQGTYVLAPAYTTATQAVASPKIHRASEYQGRPIKKPRLATDLQLPEAPTVAAREIMVLAIVSKVIVIREFPAEWRHDVTAR